MFFPAFVDGTADARTEHAGTAAFDTKWIAQVVCVSCVRVRARTRVPGHIVGRLSLTPSESEWHTNSVDT